MFVKDVMSRDVITITRDETLVDLVSKLRKHNYHTLPVIDNEKKVLGVVNSEDIMKVFLPHNPLPGNRADWSACGGEDCQLP